MANRSDCAAIVLNAGRSTRMGRAKGNLWWRPPSPPFPQGETFLERGVALARAGDVGHIAVVCSESSRPARNLHGSNITLVENPDPSQDMFESIVLALRALSSPPLAAHWPHLGRPLAVMIVLVDHPRVRPDTVVQLWQAWEHDGLRPNCVPVLGQGSSWGHPVIVSLCWAGVLEALLGRTWAGQSIAHLADFLERAWIRQVVVKDNGILQKIKTPTDYEGFFGRVVDGP